MYWNVDFQTFWQLPLPLKLLIGALLAKQVLDMLGTRIVFKELRRNGGGSTKDVSVKAADESTLTNQRINAIETKVDRLTFAILGGAMPSAETIAKRMEECHPQPAKNHDPKRVEHGPRKGSD